MAERATLVSVMRHGEVAGRAQVFRGRSDPELSPAGWAQVRAVAAQLASPPCTRVATSPLRRCRAIAEELAKRWQVPLVVEPGLAELDFGEWEELAPDEVAGRDAELYRAFVADPQEQTPPGGESFAAFRERVTDAFDGLCREEGGHCLVITHAGVMRVLLAHVLAMPFPCARRIAIGSAASFRVSLLRGQAPFLLALNGEAPCAG